MKQGGIHTGEKTLSTLQAFRFIIYDEYLGKEIRSHLTKANRDKVSVAKMRYDKGKLKANGMQGIVNLIFDIQVQTQWKLKDKFTKLKQQEV